MSHSRDNDVANPDEDVEVVDAVPVTPAAAPSPVQAPAWSTSLIASSVPAQAAAVAVTGFAAGAVTAVAVRRRRARKASGRSRKGRKQLGNVVASRSFLVDIHLLGGRD